MGFDDIFTEMTDEEMGKYLQDAIGGTKDYEDMTRLNSQINRLNAIDIYLSKISADRSKLIREYKNYEGKDAGKYLKQMLTAVKHVWEDLYWLYQGVPDVSLNMVAAENNTLMKSSDIVINEDNGSYNMILPILLPHKKMAAFIPDYANSYRSPIYNALRREYPDNRPVFKERACLIIVHEFGKDQEAVDYDNFDYVHLLNCLASFYFHDDNPSYYSMHITGKEGDRSHSEVFLAREDEFEYIWNKIHGIDFEILDSI